MLTLRAGDMVEHWNFGEAQVVKVPDSAADVPAEWEHDWDNIVLIEFTLFEEPEQEWVQTSDVDVVA